MLVEELGADALLHVRLAEGGDQVVARTEGRKTPAPGQTVTFHVRPDDVFAFHPETGARLAGLNAATAQRADAGVLERPAAGAGLRP